MPRTSDTDRRAAALARADQAIADLAAAWTELRTVDRTLAGGDPEHKPVTDAALREALAHFVLPGGLTRAGAPARRLVDQVGSA